MLLVSFPYLDQSVRIFFLRSIQSLLPPRFMKPQNRKQKFEKDRETAFTLNLFISYMDEEGWVPAVYLKRLDITAGNTPMCLRRLSGMSMRLREEASELQDVPDGGSTRK